MRSLDGGEKLVSCLCKYNSFFSKNRLFLSVKLFEMIFDTQSYITGFKIRPWSTFVVRNGTVALLFLVV